MVFSVSIFSPRWGHDDPYEFRKTANGWDVCNAGHTRHCREDGSDLVGDINGVIDVMENDGIFPPTCLPGALKYLWGELDSGEVSPSDAQAALTALAEWISQSSRAKPTGYWTPVF